MVVSRRSMIVGGAAVAAAGGLGIAGAGAAQADGYPTLRSGMSGDAVRTLQIRLANSGYWHGATDGRFGSLTLQAVYAIQKVAGLPRTGVVDAATWDHVNAGTRPTAQTTSGNALEIDKARQILMIVRGGNVAVILNTSTGGNYMYTTSRGGRALAATPSGSYKVLRAINGVRIAPLGRLYRPRYFTTTGIAVHGAASIPPYPASHGCCRVSNKAMDMIWSNNFMPIGSRVLVY